MAASLAGLHYLDGIHKVLGQADTTDLKEGDAHKDPSNKSRAVLQPLLRLAFSMDRVLPLQLQRELAIVAAHQGHLLLGP